MENLETYIEHTNLNPLIHAEDVELLVREAKQYRFAGICVPPYWVKKAHRDLGEDAPSLVTVIGFPFGYQRSEVKRKEIESALRDGAQELDVVVNLSAIKNGAYHWIKIEMAQLAQFVHEREGIIKVILETAYWSRDEIKATCKACVEGGVDFIKTSTGYGPGGADPDTVRFLREILPSSVGIKASGGIRRREQAIALLEAGAERLGSSAGIQIVKA